jgi:hypothetical protein
MSQTMRATEETKGVSFTKILFELLAKGGTVKGLIKEKDLVQVSNLVRSLYRY